MRRIPGWELFEHPAAIDVDHVAGDVARVFGSEENGEIVFDYDMAIAEPFNTSGPAPEVDMWPLFRALAEKPLLAIRGANSDLVSAEALDKMQAIAPGMKLAVVAGVGHAPELNEPEAAHALDAFLGELERTDAA